jgi:ABC-2 type transport system ATP-binding protein
MDAAMEHVITSQGLTRRFGARTVVDGLDLAIPAQSITGFLGPNGAGKTTTLSLLLGLLKAHAGSCEVLGLPPGHPAALAQIGAMVEGPSLYDHLTGRENLEITRLMRGAARSEVDRVAGLVDLTRDLRRPVREYSLGMRQRLGVALAMMGQPRLLILDEPANGLDPAGIQDLRQLLLGLPRETGAAVVLSSHILAEVEQVAGNLVVIHQGRLRYQGPAEGLGTPAAQELMCRVGRTDLARAALLRLGFPVREADGRLWIQAAEAEAPRIAEGLVGAACELFELAPQRASLEARFLALLEQT